VVSAALKYYCRADSDEIRKPKERALVTPTVFRWT
jgi:hypothetical protein